MSIIQKVFDKITKGIPKDIDKKDRKKLYTRIDSVEQGHNILKAAEEEHESGRHKADVEINTAIESDLIKFLNYAIHLIDEKYALHKMLLILRVNPIKLDPVTGNGVYLSKKYIANSLTKNMKSLVMESEIDKLEKEAIKICQESIIKTRDEGIPIFK